MPPRKQISCPNRESKDSPESRWFRATSIGFMVMHSCRCWSGLGMQRIYPMTTDRGWQPVADPLGECP